MRLSGTKTSSTSRGLGNTLWDIAGSRPTLDLDFANNKSLVDNTTGQNLITFTRAAGPATYFNSSGILVNATTDEPRFDHNPTTGESLGLLVEESRTNLALNSATFQPTSGGAPAAYTVDQVAPDGTTTGSRQTAANPRTFFEYTGIANALYTFSFYCRVTSGTAAFSIQIKNAATDTVITSDTSPVATTAWRRFTISGTTTGATTGARIELVGVVPGFVFWGAQLEAGAFPTSYIPTTTAAATRNADVASISGSNFSSGWYRQDEGTVLTLGIVPPGLANFPTLNNFSDGSANNNWSQYLHTSGYYGNVRTGNVSQGDPGRLQAPVVGSAYQIALALQQDDAMTAANGVLGAADNLLTMPTGLNDLRIGAARSGASVTNGTIRRITYWPQRLANTTLQQITS